MGKKIAIGGITLKIQSSIYDIQLAPSVVSIPTDANGNNPVLTGAKSKLVVTYNSAVIASVITALVTTNCTATHASNIISLTAITADTGQVQVNFTVDGKALSAVFTWAKAKQGNTGNQGDPGQDAYSVVLSNEAHTLPASSTGEVTTEELAKTECSVRAFRGATELGWVAANAIPGVGQFRYNIVSVTGGTAYRIDNSHFALNSITGTDTAAVITVDIHCEGIVNIQKVVTISRSKAGVPGIPGKDADPGAPGAVGPFAVFVGVYDPSTIYYGNAQRVETVKYGDVYFTTKPTFGAHNGILPTDDTKWNYYGANFKSIATDLIISERAFFDKLGVRILQTAPTGARIEIEGNEIRHYDELGLAKRVIVSPECIEEWYDGYGNVVTQVSRRGIITMVEDLSFNGYSTFSQSDANGQAFISDIPLNVTRNKLSGRWTYLNSNAPLESGFYAKSRQWGGIMGIVAELQIQDGIEITYWTNQ